MEPTVARWQLNPELRWSRFDGDGNSSWLLELDDEGGKTQRLLISESLRSALLQFSQPTPLGNAIEQLQGYTEEQRRQVGELLAGRCRAAQVLLQAEPSVPKAAPRQPARPDYLLFHLPLLQPRWVNAIGGKLHGLFSRVGLWIGAALALVGLAGLIAAMQTRPPVLAFSAAELLLLAAFGVVGVILHELGHAFAAYRFGARRVGLGVGWYVVMPVAYADLSEAWRFSRGQRVVIDFAGVYMQWLWLSVLVTAFWLFDRSMLLAAAIATGASILWNLNPLLRMDGYWLLSDVLGVTHLRQRAFEALTQRWRRRACAGAPPAALGTSTAALLILYAIASLLFLLYALRLAFGFFERALASTIPDYWSRLSTTPIADLRWDDALLALGGLIWNLVLLGFLSRFVLLSARSGWRLLRNAAGSVVGRSALS